MIDRETRIALNSLFKERAKLAKDYPHNVAEVKRLRAEVLKEEDDKIHAQMWVEIRYADAMIHKQKERLKALSLPNIAKAAELTYSVVAHQNKLFTGCGYIL